MRTMIQRRWMTAGFFAALVLAGRAWAAPPQVTSELTVERVTIVDGKTVFGPAQVSKPGDILEYRARYTNRSASAVLGLVANLPIPPGTTLIDRSQIPPDALASTDGTHFAPLPLTRVTRLADGSEHQVLVPLEEYRGLRWNLGSLSPGRSAQVQARVRVNDVPPPATDTTPGPADRSARHRA
jgi:uncharacterized repeat protein (TIGR01451 family)